MRFPWRGPRGQAAAAWGDGEPVLRPRRPGGTRPSPEGAADRAARAAETAASAAPPGVRWSRRGLG